jgi:hypothetical protein
VTDPSRTAARVLWVLLATAVAALLASILLGAAPLAPRLQVAGLWTIVVGPFLVLAIVSAAKPRTRWFAAGTVALALIGLLLAR